MRESNWFILRDIAELKDYGRNEIIYVLRFGSNVSTKKIQRLISDYMCIYADYDMGNPNEEIETYRKELEKCGCQFDFAMKMLGKDYEDLEIEECERDNICLWY